MTESNDYTDDIPKASGENSVMNTLNRPMLSKRTLDNVLDQNSDHEYEEDDDQFVSETTPTAADIDKIVSIEHVNQPTSLS